MRGTIWAAIALLAALAGGCGNSSGDPLQAKLAGAGTGVQEPPITGSTRTPRQVDPQVTKSADALVATAVPGATTYKIGPQDVLEITVFKVPELSKNVQVADSGTINLPLVGDIAAAGRTAQDIERDLSQKLGAKYLRNPQVTVFVKEYNSQRITVEGAVRKPDVFPFRGRATLLQVIAMAGGLDTVSDTNVVVFRTMNNKRAAAKFDIEDIRTGKATDPAIESGDVVVVATSAYKETLNNIMKVLPLAGVFALL